MQYLVQMKIVAQARPSTLAEGVAFFTEYIHPTLQLCKKLQDDGKILAGGPISVTIGLVLRVANGRAFSYHSSAGRERQEECAPCLLPNRWLLVAS